MARVAKRSPRWTHRAIVYVYPGGRVFFNTVTRDPAAIEEIRGALTRAAHVEDLAQGLYVVEADGAPFVKREPTTKGAA